MLRFCMLTGSGSVRICDKVVEQLSRACDCVGFLVGFCLLFGSIAMLMRDAAN